MKHIENQHRESECNSSKSSSEESDVDAFEELNKKLDNDEEFKGIIAKREKQFDQHIDLDIDIYCITFCANLYSH